MKLNLFKRTRSLTFRMQTKPYTSMGLVVSGESHMEKVIETDLGFIQVFNSKQNNLY